MDINNVNKYNTNSFVQTKNRTNLNNNQFEEKLNNIFNKSSKADEYIPSKELNESLHYVRYDHTKTIANNVKPILKHCDKGIITLTDKYLFFTPYEGEEKSGVESEKLENETNSNIVVNADGSRVLIITMIIGGMETSMSIEISKPTELQNNAGSMLEKDTVQLQQNLETVEGDAGN